MLDSIGLQNSLHFIQYISLTKTLFKMIEISQSHVNLQEFSERVDHYGEVELSLMSFHARIEKKSPNDLPPECSLMK